MDKVTKKWHSLGFLEGMENNEMVVTAKLMEEASEILISNIDESSNDKTLDFHENVFTCTFPFIYRLVKNNPAMCSKSININIDVNHIIGFLDKNLKSHYDLFKPKGDDKELEFLTNLISNYI